MKIEDEVINKFKQPLRYDKEDQRIFDADNRLVVDVRAWGYLSSTIPNQQLAMQIQDTLGEMIAKAFNHCYNEANYHKHDVMQGCQCKDRTGETTVWCCNQCGLPCEEGWLPTYKSVRQPTVGREREEPQD
jgi:hypothetical protein